MNGQWKCKGFHQNILLWQFYRLQVMLRWEIVKTKKCPSAPEIMVQYPIYKHIRVTKWRSGVPNIPSIQDIVKSVSIIQWSCKEKSFKDIEFKTIISKQIILSLCQQTISL